MGSTQVRCARRYVATTGLRCSCARCERASHSVLHYVCVPRAVTCAVRHVRRVDARLVVCFVHRRKAVRSLRACLFSRHRTRSDSRTRLAFYSFRMVCIVALLYPLPYCTVVRLFIITRGSPRADPPGPGPVGKTKSSKVRSLDLYELISLIKWD